MNEPTSRIYNCWVDGFLELTKDYPSPALFREWAAVMTLAGAMERRAFTYLKRNLKIFPNEFVMLVAPPGVGKSVIIDTVGEFWKSLGTVKLSNSDLTKSALVDQLEESAKKIQLPNEDFDIYSALSIPSREFGNLMNYYDQAFLNFLNDMYDGINVYQEGRRHKKEATTIDKPLLNIVSAIQPGFMEQLFPKHAFEMGIMSRFMLVYSATGPDVRLFEIDPADPDDPQAAQELYDDTFRMLLSDLEHVTTLQGMFKFDKETRDAMEQWFQNGMEPKPSSNWLQHYVVRRPTHLIKLCMIFSAARSDEMVIRHKDYERAADLMLRTESEMINIFSSVASSDEYREAETIMDWLAKEYSPKQAIPYKTLYYKLARRLASWKIEPTIKSMEASGMLEDVTNHPSLVHKPGRFFRVRPRSEWGEEETQKLKS